MKEDYAYLEHVTDALIEAYGSTLEEAFSNAARATTNTIVDIEDVRAEEKEQIEVKGRDLEELLYNWLEKILSLVDARGFLLSDFRLKIFKEPEGFSLQADCRGQKFDPTIHEFKTAVKAPTYHDMNIQKVGPRYVLRFLLDL